MKEEQLLKWLNLENLEKIFNSKSICKQEKPSVFFFLHFAHKEKRVIIYKLTLATFNNAKTIRKISEGERNAKKCLRISNLIKCSF